MHHPESNSDIVRPRPALRTLTEIGENTFIFEKQLALPVELCEEMISRFEQHAEEQYEGRIGQMVYQDQSIKKSTDLMISGRDDWAREDALFRESMRKAIVSLSALHPFFSSNRFKDMGYNLQRTREGEYYHWQEECPEYPLRRDETILIFKNKPSHIPPCPKCTQLDKGSD